MVSHRHSSVNLQLLCEQAVRLHQSGKTAEAELLYKQILEIEPASFTANYLLGLIRFQHGQNAEALKLLDAALRVNPGSAEAYTIYGLALQAARRLEDAIASFNKALAIKPGLMEALSNRGTVLHDLKRFEEALASYDQALAIKPDFALAFYNRGITLQSLQRFDEALTSYGRALAINPSYPDALRNRGSLLSVFGLFEKALADFTRALAIEPNNAVTLYNVGTTQRDLRRFAQALASFDKVLAIKPDFAEALNNRGAALHGLKRFDDALESYDRALAIKSDFAEALSNRADSLQALGRFDEALASCDKALTLEPGFAAALNNRGSALHGLKRFADAVDSYNRALAIKPDLADALYNRGMALQELKRFAEAIASYDKALVIKPDFAEVMNNRGIALHNLKYFEEALASYDRALTVKPEYAEAFANRAIVLQELKRFPDALSSYDKALAIKPDYAEALHNRGMMKWTENKDYEGAVRDLEKAVSVDPDFEYARGDLLHLRMHGADWHDFAAEAALVDAGVRAGRRIANPFIYQAISESPMALQTCSVTFASHRYPPLAALWKKAERNHAKIRVGYVSGEFREQATAFLAVGLYEAHDKGRFEVIGFDNGRNDAGPTRKRLEMAFDKIIDISSLSDPAAAKTILDEEIDILVNLNGYFGRARMEVFAYRPAPIQVNYLGFPATLGAPYIDYILADRTVIPPDERQYYTENVVYLPETYQANDSKRPIAEVTLNRAKSGLPEKAFVFCNFNQSYKFTPGMFACWMRILRQVEGSVLWILRSNAIMPGNLKREAERLGISADRLVFAPPAPPDRHLARLKLADLFLDSLPYNAHTTASDALWAGLPLLTCAGKSFPGRVAASLLGAMGMPELVADNLEAYEALAVKLARNPEFLESIRQKLIHNRLNASLFDTDRFRQHIESAYATMWDIFQTGQGPHSFSVDPILQS
jgi:protein O-GlcNAc transferase